MSNPDGPRPRNLIIVCGQSVYKANDYATWSARKTPSDWVPGRDEPRKYGAHVEQGVALADQDPRALLIVSGGQTRAAAGPISEALSYWKVAEQERWWGRPAVAGRCALEEYARDSFENLLFSICRFFECVGAYPRTVTLIGFAMKGTRFAKHRKAIGWPAAAYVFQPVGDPDLVRKQDEDEQVADSIDDPLGFKNPAVEKRLRRNPFQRRPPYLLSCPHPFDGFPVPHLWSAVLNR